MILRSVSALCLLATIGCGAAEGPHSERMPTLGESLAQTDANEIPSASATGATTDSPVPSSPVPEGRKIIFEAQLHIDVSDFGAAAKQVDHQVLTHGGFVTASQRGGRSGSSRSGEWTLRVPVEQYRPLIEALVQLGELLDHSETSQEVTDEYYDLEARIKNKQQEEQRLLTHLDQTARGLDEILTIEREVSRVRGEVERMQGRLRLLADQTSLSTIHLTLEEIDTFVPAESPTFATRISRTWKGSVESVTQLLQFLALTATAITPWLVVVLPLGLVILLWVRRRLGQSLGS